MYDVKNMPLSSARKAITQKNNRQWKDVSLPKYCLKDREVNAGLYRVTQQRPLFCHFDRAAVQLRQDDAKLVASTYGTDPSIGRIGLTAHHIIPSSLLEWFYDMCKSMENENIQRALQDWEAQSVEFANNSARHRDSGMDFSSDNNPDLTEMVKSACVWMNGNVFIGPNTEYRLDDAGNIFDYGGYRSLEKKGVGSPLWTDVNEGNGRMKTLGILYDKLKYIEAENKKSSPDSNLDKVIVEVLGDLTHLACEDHTIHKKEDAADNTPAYNPDEWICIGQNAILGGKNASKLEERTYTFIEMFNDYLLYKEEKKGSWKEFCVLFEKNIKIGNASKIWKNNNKSYVMSKHTYVALYCEWKKCLGKSLKKR